MKTETQTIPTGAMRFDVGPCEFGESGKGKEDKTIPVRIKARDGGIVNHWYWGRVVHDMAGMELHKESLPIDYVHFADEVIGYLDNFDVSSGDLVCEGALVPFADGDRVDELVHKSRAGVPYEASISYDGPLRIEQLDTGTKAEVNGRTVEGPLMVFRQWSLRGVAICPYGADRNTKTQLTQGDEMPVTIISEESSSMSMFKRKKAEESDAAELTAESKTQAESQPETDGAETDATDAQLDPTAGQLSDKPAGESDQAAGEQAAKPDGQKFLDAFGPQGGVWFAEGKTFDEAQKLFANGLKAQNEKLEERLASIDRGEKTPVSATADQAGGKTGGTQEQAGNFGENLSALVAHNADALGRRN